MFESDQYELDDDYQEPAHPAPPSPKPAQAAPPPKTEVPSSSKPENRAAPIPPPTPRPAAPLPRATQPEPSANPPQAAPPAVNQPTASYEPIVEEEPAQQEEAEEFFEHDYSDPAESEPPPPPPKKTNWMLYGGFAAVALLTAILLYVARPKQEGPPPGDLGPGVVAVSGLRGHLMTRWEGDAKTGKLMYQLHIEPMEDRWQKGFSRAASNPPSPLSVNVRLLDVNGFALCGKEIDFHFDPQTAGVPMPAMLTETAGSGKRPSPAERLAAAQSARQSQIIQMQAQEAARERGKDIFQNQKTDDGEVTAVNAQGALPCSPDQYKRTDYWDFNTNFPTLDEQAALLDPRAAQRAKNEFEPPPHPDKRTLEKLKQGFVMQGDDRVTAYDSVRGVLLAQERSFLVDKNRSRDTATMWANNYSLIHYRCDQRGNCALTQAGGVLGLRAKLNE